MSRTPRAVTLLELLIVAGILAILAAVAVPNLLEAQTRSKVSKAKAHLRVLVDALDVYRIDWNSYPATGSVLPGDPLGLLADVQLARLTTPIHYLTASAFRDPFGQVRSQVLTGVGATQSTLLGASQSRQEFPVPDLPNRNRSLIYFHYPTFSRITGNALVRADGVAAISLGPDALDSFGAFRPFPAEALPPLARAVGLNSPLDTDYDPTNGTVSNGDISGFTGDLPVRRIP